MSRMSLGIVIAFIAWPLSAAIAQDRAITNFGELEEIARIYMTEAHVAQGGQNVKLVEHFELELLAPAPVDVDFPRTTSSLDTERELIEAYCRAYLASMEDVIERARALAEEHEFANRRMLRGDAANFINQFVRRYGGELERIDPRDPADEQEKARIFNELSMVLTTMFPRYAEIYSKAQLPGGAIYAMLQDRQAVARGFLGRYNMGPELVTTDLQGSALLMVSLSDQARGVVDQYMSSLQTTPLLDATGHAIEWQGRALEINTTPMVPELENALHTFENEVFVMRYAVRRGDTEEDLILITGARLMFGTFFFVEMNGRLIIMRDPA